MATNMSDPRLQRDLQKNRAKRSMGAGKGVLASNIGKIVGRHAAYQQGVKQSFRGLEDQKKSSVMAHKSRMAELNHSSRMLGMREDALSDQKKMMPWNIGRGLLSAIGAGYTGYQRKKDIEKSTALK